MMTEVEKYKARRARRMEERKRRLDDEEERNNANNGGGSRGHGNTRLPYGLCRKHGIEIEKGWQPRDVWNALADKGITPGNEFAKRSGRQTTIKTKGATYSDVKAGKYGDTYTIKGDMQMMSKGEPYGKVSKGAQLASFKNKKEMFACLKEYGVNHVIDPDTGEKVNPMKMDLPKTVAKKGEQRFVDLVLGTRRDKSGRVGDRRGFTLVAKDFDGKKINMGVFDSPEKAKEYAERFLSCKGEDIRKTKDFKDWEGLKMTPEQEYAERSRRREKEMERLKGN